MNALRLFPFSALAAAAVVASGFGARFGVWDWRAGFTILRWGTYASLGIAALAFVALLVPKLRARGSLGLAIALLLAGGAAAVPLYWLQQARAVPPINDVTTDPGNPPAFVAILPLRADAPVPAAYPGEATASAQRNAYPDLVPIVVPRPPLRRSTRRSPPHGRWAGRSSRRTRRRDASRRRRRRPGSASATTS